MSENIGYEIPPSLKYEEKIFAGLTKRQLIYLVTAFALCTVLIKFTSFLSVYGTAYKFILIIVLCSIVTMSLAICQLRLDSWFVTVSKYMKKKNKINRFDKEMLNYLSLRSINHDHYYNVFGDACTILKLYTLTGDRSDAKNIDTIQSSDTDFLNSLPCPIQLIGHSSHFDIDKYVSMVMNGVEFLSDDQQKLMIGHLNHIKSYCDDENVKDKTVYMVIKTPINTINQIEKLDIDTKTIIQSLTSCYVVGERLTGHRLTNTLLMLSCGVGRDGVDYLADCVTLEDI